MAKRSGLGRGLDGMFTSYLGTDTKDSKNASTGKAASRSAAASTGKKSDTTDMNTGKAEKAKKSGNKASEKRAAKSGSLASKKASAQEKTGFTEAETADDGVVMLKISQVEPNREQPRKEFQEDGLNELAASIKQYGIIQPLVVQKRDDYYEIIAGERRWRAARIAGVKEVPVVIKDYSEQEIVEVSLIENIQREDLNPIEEALAYQRLLDEFSLRQEDVAKRVSKNRTTITNSLRLLKLDERVRDFLIDGRLSGGHARALLGLENKDQQFEAANRVIAENLSVREVEKLVRSIQRGNAGKKKEPKKDSAMDAVCADMEQHMKTALGTKVRVNRRSGKTGRIEIEYYSMEELERIYDLIRTVGDHG